MPNRNAFIAIIDTFKAAAPAITKEQSIGLLRQATQQYGLSFEDAEQLLKHSGLVVGDVVNYFEVLELSVEELQNQTEAEIATRVDTAYHKHYRASLTAGARPSEVERRTTLNVARKILKDAEKRRAHIATLQPERASTPMPDERMPDARTFSTRGPKGYSVLNVARKILKDAEKRRAHIATLQPERASTPMPDERMPDARTFSTRGPKGYSVEQKLDAILFVIERGYSGGNAARTLDPPATSTTVNTWVRQFTGRYRSGDPMPADRIPAWVEEARQLYRQKSGQGDSANSASVPIGMVLIPAGDFQMGREAYYDEKPMHTVYVDAFYMDTYQVTNAQYKAFVDANPQWQKDNIPDKYHAGHYLLFWSGNSYPSGEGNHPVVCVSWYAAMAYAQWAGKRLPTEAEWEKSARGGLVGKEYPWGDTIDANKANYDRNVGTTPIGLAGSTTPVGTYAPNGYGLYDMAGNVWEWCVDGYKRDFSRRVLRGGGWADTKTFLRVANRDSLPPTYTNSTYGFRCARDITP